ncbi:MAG: MDR family MFS transporter [Calditrichaceae bacterium]
MIKKAFSGYRSAFSGLPTDVWLLSFVVFINRSGSMVLFFLAIYLTQKLNFSVSEAGRMISVYGIGSMSGAFLGGWLSDRFGTGRVQLYSLIFSGIGFIVLGYVTTPIALAVTLFLLATVADAFRPANATALAGACPPEFRARGFALNRLAINFGIAIGPAVGGVLATMNYHYLFWADGLTCLFASLFFWLFFHKVKFRKAPPEETASGDISPWRDSVFLSMLGLLLVMGMLFVQIFNTWPLYLRQETGFPENNIGFLLAMNALLIVLIEMPLVHRLERADPVKIMGIGSLFLFGGFGIIPFNDTYGYMIFTVIIWSIGEMLVFPLAGGFIANRATDRNRGRYMGMFTFSFSISFVVGPATGTWIYETFGPVNLWYSAGIAGIFVWLGFGFIKQLLKREKRVN